MAIYGISLYGDSLYGYLAPPPLRVDPFTAIPVSYSAIQLSWTKPSGTVLGFRIVKNMYGFPVDQDDGSIILDTTAGWPGSNLSDSSVTPGRYHYYGFYCLTDTSTDTWVRSGLTGCLMPSDYHSSARMLNLVPSFYLSNINQENELAADPTGNPFLASFMSVIGWGMDYLRTQYDTYLNVNNPWTVPVNDLHNLAAELDLNINPDIHPYTLRKAVLYNAPVNKSKGTEPGIEMELSALTGWDADITTGVNLLLDNDQSYQADPAYADWTSAQAYTVSERVTYGVYIYQCIATGNKGNSPTGTSSSNTWWEAVLSVLDRTVLLNSATGNISTWENLWPGASNGDGTSTDLSEDIGILNPSVTSHVYNGLNLINSSGSAQDVWLRTISRTIPDLTNVTATFAPGNTQVISEGIPVPSSAFALPWNPETAYLPQQAVTYDNQPFMALRASFNSVPPYAVTGTSSQDWAPLGFDERQRICLSSEVSSTVSQKVYPFIEWYDSSGNYITRVFSRNPAAGVVAVPGSLCFDSFVTGAGISLSGRITDDTAGTWTNTTGEFLVSPYSGGCAYPQSDTVRSIATVNPGIANCQAGITFVTQPPAGWSTGLVLRHVSDTSYLRADMTTLRKNNGGTWTTLGTYSTACVPGDRLLVTISGNTVTAYRNNVSVLSVTTTFNAGTTVTGIITELT
jgi:hypothetical protein